MIPGDKSPDGFETRFWLSTVAAGGWITILMGLSGGIYTVFFAAEAHRLGVGVMTAVTIAVGALALWGVPWRRLVASRWRESAFLTWTVLTIGMVAGLAAFDGGAESPLALPLFLPAVFASLAYPRRLVVMVAVLAEAAFLALTFIHVSDLGYVLVFCSVLAGAAVMAVWQAGIHDSWRHQLARSSRTDPLTGLLNRRGFAVASDAAFSALARHRRPLTLLIIDLDLFKAYNDTHGHQAGDELLRWLATQLRGAVRPGDAVARLGGDEFAVLLADTGPDSAEPAIVRFGAALDHRVAHCLGRASAPEDGSTFEALYRAADTDLYQRKLLRPRRPLEEASPEARFEHRKQHRQLSADAILAGITEAFYALDEEWRFVYINKPAEGLIGRAAHELLGRSVWELYPEAVGSKFDEVYRRVAATGRSETFTEFFEPLGSTFLVKASPMQGGISIYFHDVTCISAQLSSDNSGQVPK